MKHQSYECNESLSVNNDVSFHLGSPRILNVLIVFFSIRGNNYQASFDLLFVHLNRLHSLLAGHLLSSSHCLQWTCLIEHITTSTYLATHLPLWHLSKFLQFMWNLILRVRILDIIIKAYIEYKAYTYVSDHFLKRINMYQITNLSLFCR